MLHPVAQAVQSPSCFERTDALLVEEVLVEQGADRAEVDHVAGERVIDRVAGKTSISAWLPRRITSSSPVWVISRVNRNAAGAHDARSWLSWIRSETSLRG